MKKIVLTIIACIAIFAELPSRAEETYVLPDNFTILDEVLQVESALELKEYSVTYRNLQENYGPKDFSTCELFSCEEEISVDNPMENYVSYVYTNGSRLIMPNAVSLIYGNTEREKYEQLIVFFRNTSYPEVTGNLSFQNRDVAIEFCIKTLGRLGIDNLCVDKVIPLSSELISDQTEKMLSYYGSNALQYFNDVDINNEAYYISFRYLFGEVEMLGEPQAEFIITANGISSLKLYHILETIDDSVSRSGLYPVEKVLRHFAEEHYQQRSELDLYTITDVKCVYYPLYDSKQPSSSVRYIPCWKVSAICEYHFGNRKKTVNVSGLYSMKDGTQYVE